MSISTSGSASMPRFCLQVGLEASLEQLKALWFDFNNKRCYEISSLQSKSPCPQSGICTHISKCYNAPKTGWSRNTICKAHMKCKGPSKDKMKIISLQLDLTCPGSTSQNRKRNNKVESASGTNKTWNSLAEC